MKLSREIKLLNTSRPWSESPNQTNRIKGVHIGNYKQDPPERIASCLSCELEHCFGTCKWKDGKVVVPHSGPRKQRNKPTPHPDLMDRRGAGQTVESLATHYKVDKDTIRRWLRAEEKKKNPD